MKHVILNYQSRWKLKLHFPRNGEILQKFPHFFTYEIIHQSTKDSGRGQIVNSQQPTTIKSVCRSFTCCPLEVWAVAEAAGSNSAVLRATCFWSSASSVSDSESELPVDLLLCGRTTTSFGTTSSFFGVSVSGWFILKGMATKIKKIILCKSDVHVFLEDETTLLFKKTWIKQRKYESCKD